jgi:Do/DeqQ family serine protease
MRKQGLKLTVCALMLGLTTSAMYAQCEQGAFVRTAATSSFDTDFTVAAEKTVNSVVCIKSYVSRQQNSYTNSNPFDLFDFFFGPQQQQRQQQPRQQQKKSEPVQSGLGSGVIITADGYIVTNNHVIDGADKLEVLLNDNSTYEAKIIGADEATDLALIKIEANNLSPITFGDSESVKIGEWVLAVGNPFGFNSTVTAGIISAKGRSLGSNSNRVGIESYLQTDAALNPGNSGGALVNLKGELIGINAAIYSNTGSYTGFSFAIPTSITKKVITDIRQYGTVQRAVLGVTVGELDSKIAKDKGITCTNSGLIISSVEDRSTAKELGLQENDVIVGVNDVTIHTLAELQEQMSKYRPGDKITISYYRNNKLQSKTGTLRNNQGNTEIVKKEDFSSLGCAFMKVSDETKEHLGITYGVQVVGLQDGRFKDEGITEGFVILTINDERVNSSDDVERIFNKIMKSDDSDKVMIISGVYPTGKKRYYAVNLNQ